MDLKLEGKKALVTGSTAGIGHAIAKLLAAEGAEVIINGRSQQSTEDAVASIIKVTGNETVAGIAADFSRSMDIENLISQVNDLDILVNNVGIFNAVPFEKITDPQWLEVFEVNVMSGVRLSRHYLPLMLKKNEGRVIFISSESSQNIPTEMIHYGMSKTAQLAISRGLARLCQGTNVTVNSVLPGPTWSRANEEALSSQADEEGKTVEEVIDDFFRRRRPTSLIQRFADVDEVATMVAYIASPLSSATNGAALRVDGGVVNSII